MDELSPVSHSDVSEQESYFLGSMATLNREQRQAIVDEGKRYLKLYRKGKLIQGGKKQLVLALANKWFRLNTLYKIKTKELDSADDMNASRVKVFKPNRAQLVRFIEGHNRDLILKARQLGFTTFEMIDSLDDCLFIDNFAAGCIAHRMKSAQDIFRNKIKFAYENINEAWLLIFERIGLKFPTPINDRGEMYVFDNGSSISVGTSYRGDTLMRLHVSEFGKICATRPDVATEIVTGAFESVPKTGQITLESTAEGRSGYFFMYSQEAQANRDKGKRLTYMDFQFHFFPWYEEPDYRLDEYDDVVISQELRKYFAEKSIELDIEFDEEQIAWYASKQKTLGDKMKREYPTTPKEAFEQAIEGAYYASEITKARKEKRITKVPYDPQLPVYTFWDLGRNDTNAIWFMQVVGMQHRFIDYFEDSGESLHYYAKILIERGYVYAMNYLPHDANVTDYSREDNKPRAEVLAELGFKVTVVPRIPDINEGIHMTRMAFPSCWFDEENCDLGINRLEHYRKEWNEKTETFKDKPLHSEASNGADAFRQFAQGFRTPTGKKRKARRAQGGMAA